MAAANQSPLRITPAAQAALLPISQTEIVSPRPLSLGATAPPAEAAARADDPVAVGRDEADGEQQREQLRERADVARARVEGGGARGPAGQRRRRGVG